MKTTLVNFRSLASGRVTDKALVLENNRVLGFFDPQDPKARGSDLVWDCQGLFLSPGFIDLHVHGGGGSDFMDAEPEGFDKIARVHASHGITSLLPTSLAAGEEEIVYFLQTYEAYMAGGKNPGSGARFLGVHLEGPYFSMEYRGAQAPLYIRQPELAEVQRILATSPSILRWSIAPEVPGVPELAKILRQRGILMSLAHTAATAAQVREAEAQGFTLATHLYSGMSSITRDKGLRVAGTVEGSLLSDTLSVELIADGKHLPLELLALVYKTKNANQIILTTDAMRAAGTTDTQSILGSKKKGQPVIIRGGVAKLPDETALAGSIATGDLLVRTMVHAGVPLSSAIAMVTENPARLLGKYPQIGALEPGSYADLVIFDQDLTVHRVMVDGQFLS